MSGGVYMQQIHMFFAFVIVSLTLSASAQTPNDTPVDGGQLPAARVVEIKAADGTILKASYFAAVKPGPGALLFHQSNRTRQSWDDIATQLASAGINTLTIDERGYGESSGKKEARALYHDGDLDAAF